MAGVLLLLGSLRLTPGVAGTFLDDGIYISTARALAEDGTYKLAHLPSAPAQTKYPILYPAALAVIWKIWPSFPENVTAMQWLSLIVGALAVGLACLYLTRFGHATRLEAALACGLCASSPTFLYFATQPLSEMLFALLVVAALWSTDRAIGLRTEARPSSILSGMLIALPFLCRTVGAAITAGCLLARYRSRVLVWRVVAGIALLAVPWLVWLIQAGSAIGADEPAAYYSIRNYLQWWALPESLARVVGLNLLWLLTGTAILTVVGLAASTPIATAGRLLLAPLIGISLGQVILRTGGALCGIGVYLSVILFWTWPPVRFLIPVLPIIALSVVRLVAAGLRLTRVPYPHVALVAVIVCVLSANLVGYFKAVRVIRDTGYPFLTIPAQPVAWDSFQELFDWIEQHTSDEDVIAAGIDSMTYLYTERRAIRPFTEHPTALFYGDQIPPLGTPQELAANLERYRPKFLLQHPMPGFEEEAHFFKLIEDTRTLRPGCLTEVLRLQSDSRFLVYEVNLPNCAPARKAQ